MTKKNLLRKLLTAPETAVEHLDLIYVDARQLPIARMRRGKGFTYRLGDNHLTDKEHLERINGLVIPPAWENVKITHLPNGHLQAVGKDAKNRKQYRYHSTWVKIRNQTKFFKMAAFGKQLPKVREQIDKDLSEKGWPKRKVVALVIKLMDETHIRIGNEQYARRNKSYGLSTLRKKHVDIYKNRMKFEFVGKKGKKHAVTVRNKKLIRLVGRCEDIPGWELFQYYDDDGEKQSLDSSMVNEYIHEISSEFFTAKDFRTWAASVIFFETLFDLGMAVDQKEIESNILIGYDAAAKALGNTRAVCRKYYVHPLLVSSYKDGSLKKSFSQVEDLRKETQNFSPSENAILKLIEGYRPELVQH